ncbi:MAG: aminotransferase class I/II-fold pyridoxal phosphate-dependent enzyme [Desulfobacula sp.]|jgi:aspartate/methionine/tyrosine aminotransferase|uniref:aminotransferase class I/II-fold pyridoxal phosphate-dependent enzyme n=1 Tax=Desulfobacula sp. TaxID=2593537 RepID=UPI001DF518D2|nr:aminotransferase class I/II-fold pyridoxal phosphate-dependent enzyme [Desulfobacula sp.]MBT3484423.1 aminotransferase class I/II-fold pyridoxal phosphate-dependent enzyme [Desulfobacula sp.]MBT3803338.1 aminotransferase class I/II-fold pyridoxal phosphate-dependent enzyme [Desulfobacula sp.]MBT4023695.1 aminotransferase class I/II-fold pyridoxal phosphate-dependent enzyme [Desulfobacula sp.]MBT4197937.1 aminotransferase class I/II-fold pyridoxal phosphate-dependent enzyme [Desulfobacula sp.
MNPIAKKLNKTINGSNPHVFEMLSNMGKELFFPKGILSQSAEAKQKADKINATIGIAKEGGKVLSLSSLTKYINNIEPDDYLTYAPSFGLPALRSKWKNELYKKNTSLKNKAISLPVVTSGITHGVSIFSDMWIDPNDVIVMPDMMWGNYNMTFCIRNNARIVHYKAYDDKLTRFNIDSFEKVIYEQAKKNDKIITVLNFPHNPSGYSLNVTEAQKVASILIDIAQKGTNVVAACDDAYFGLYFEEDTCKESIFSKLAGADKRLIAIKLDGATKEDYAWGLRIGFITYGICGDNNTILEALEKKTAGCIRGNISNASHLSQTIILKSMSDENYEIYKQEKFELLKRRALKIKKVLINPKYNNAFDVYPFNSGYFMCIRLKDVDAEELRVHLLDNYGTGLISIGKKNIRVAFSCLEESDVETLFDIILSGISDLKKG